MLSKNDLHHVAIEGWSSEGLGICRIDGMVTFVSGGVPGDCCEIRITKALKNRAYARVERLLEPAETRAENDCPHFPKCGGCDFRHVRYEEELRFKLERVSEALRRIGGLSVEVPPVIGSARTDSYRNKAIYQVGAVDGRPAHGFYRRHSHDLFAVERCLLQSEAADRAAGEVMAWAREIGVSVYDERSGEGWLRYLFCRSSSAGALQLCLVATDRARYPLDGLVERLRIRCPELSGILLMENKRPGNVALHGETRTLWGEPALSDRLCGIDFSISPRSFYQVNHAQTERLYRQVLDCCALTGEETVLDLYCGIGTISLCLARYAKRVIGIEEVPEAVENARDTARRNGIQNAEFICGDAAMAAEMAGIDVAVVDPPRKGLHPEVVEHLLRLAAPKLVYVSCDSATLARDLRLLCAGGYGLQSVQPFDLFPRTVHVETVCLMTYQTPGKEPG